METVSRVSPAIAGKILTEPEQACLQNHPDPSAQQRLLALYFSAKEAIYKCLHPLLQSRIGFEDALIECDARSMLNKNIPVPAHSIRSSRR